MTKGFTLRSRARWTRAQLLLTGVATLAWGTVAWAQVPLQTQEPTDVPDPAQSEAQAPLKGPPTAGSLALPLWELGLGLGAIGFRDYRGSDTTHAYPVPFAYFIYRGKFLQADRNGLKSKLFRQVRLEINVSMSATTPVRDNATRQGMPELRPTVELGPSLDVHVWRSDDERMKLDVRLPVRAAFTIGSPGSIGWFFTPNINLDIASSADATGWKLGMLTGPLFAARRYDDYYYSVATRYATPDRPAYQATGGYAGAQVLASLTRRYPKFWAGAYVRYDNLAGAVFENSPLVKSQSYWSAGIGFAWMVAQSARNVVVPD